MLRHIQFGDAEFSFVIGVIDLVAIQEHHDVSILLESTRLAQVRKCRAFVIACFKTAAQLTKRQNWHFEFACQEFEFSTYLADFKLSVFWFAVTTHKLQVVDNNQRDFTLSTNNAASFCANRADRGAWAVVNNQRNI